MEHLTKHQLLLVALLVSFVTSLATGIVTVSLMDQAPQGVTRTVTQVIRETVAGAIPVGATSTAAVAIAISDQVAEATAKIIPSVVRVRDGSDGRVVALGLIVSKSGAIMTDKNVIEALNSPQVIFSNGSAMPATVTRFQNDGEVVFLAPLGVVLNNLQPVSIGGAARLGSSVWALSGTSSYALSQGITAELQNVRILTTISGQSVLPGSPLFDVEGNVLGLALGSQNRPDASVFYPAILAKDGIPQ